VDFVNLIWVVMLVTGGVLVVLWIVCVSGLGGGIGLFVLVVSVMVVLSVMRVIVLVIMVSSWWVDMVCREFILIMVDFLFEEIVNVVRI